MEKSLVGEDFGARDAYAGEIETGFGSKSLGNADTLHIMKPPSGIEQFIGLGAMEMTAEGEAALKPEEVWTRRSRVPGWQVIEEGGLRIAQTFKLRDGDAAAECLERFRAVEAAAGAGDAPYAFHAARAEGAEATVELRTAAAEGVTQNDFIMAARLNQVDLKDLLPEDREQAMKKKRMMWV